MSNGDMLNTIKKLVESGDDFTVKQYRMMSLSGMVELGDSIKGLEGEIAKGEKKDLLLGTAVEHVKKDITRLEGKSNRNDTIVGIGTLVGSIIGFVFGSK